MDTPTLVQFLTYLVGGGAIIAVSWVAEQFDGFQKLAARAKQAVIFGASVALATGAYCVVTYVPASSLEAAQPFFMIVATAFISIFLGQMFHSNSKSE